jgi:cyclopropane-fatty-acyl-phospholipid synthase
MMSKPATARLDILCEPSFQSRFCLREKAARWLFSSLIAGTLRLHMPSGSRWVIEGSQPGPEAELHIHSWHALWKTIRKGDLGFADAYIDGDWDTPDLTQLIRLLGRNRSQLVARIAGLPLFRLLPRLKHAVRVNTRRNSRRNIEAHYDLGNDFYALWLDPAMIYSSAIFATGDRLEAAQARKLARITELLALEDDASVLEIGCGWGALAHHIGAATRGEVLGVTLSPSQLAHAQGVVRDQANVTLALRDYRDVTGPFDRIVSIEMIEAVGESYLPTYFKSIARNLRPDGRAVIQAITIHEDIFGNYRRDTDFIQAYIFPGGFLPTRTLLAEVAARAGLRLQQQEGFGASYALTLDAWQARFEAAWPEIEKLGFDARFRRTWNYYLSYCSAGFSEGLIDVGLYVFERADGGARDTP